VSTDTGTTAVRAFSAQALFHHGASVSYNIYRHKTPRTGRGRLCRFLSLMYPRLLPDLLTELGRDEWLGAGVLTEAGKARIENDFRDLEANPHTSVPGEEAGLRFMAPFKR
jgi:hypothetical protein